MMLKKHLVMDKQKVERWFDGKCESIMSAIDAAITVNDLYCIEPYLDELSTMCKFIEACCGRKFDYAEQKYEEVSKFYDRKHDTMLTRTM